MDAPTEFDLAFEDFVIKHLQTERDAANADLRPYMQAEADSERVNLARWYAAGKEALATVEPGLDAASRMVYVAVLRKTQNPDSLAVFAFRSKLVVAPLWLTVYRETKSVVEMYRAVTGQSPL